GPHYHLGRLLRRSSRLPPLPAWSQVGDRVSLPGSDRCSPRLTARSGTQRARLGGPLRHGHMLGRPCAGRTERMGFASLVVRQGDHVTASGRLVRNETGDWFEPLMPVALPGGVPRRVRAAWRGAVRIVGANFDELSDRFDRDQAVEGCATLTGIWLA